MVMISREDGKWNDVPCNYNLPYICKKGTGETPSDHAELVSALKFHWDSTVYIWNKHFGDTLQLKFPCALTMILQFFYSTNILLVANILLVECRRKILGGFQDQKLHPK